MKLTVLLPVYNAEKFLNEALDSILSQTFKDFEILAIDDHSTDSSLKILKKYSDKDKRIRILTNSKNLGVTQTLNLGLKNIQTEFVARMDADDICAPERFERQIKFLDTHQDVSVCGTWIYIFTKVPKLGFSYMPPTDSDEIKACFLFENCIQHPTIMFRVAALVKNKAEYPVDYPHVEDYALWMKLVDKIKFANVPKQLLYYRLHSTQVGKVHSKKQNEIVLKVHKEFIKKLGLTPTAEELKIHENICFGINIPQKENINKIEAWLEKLIEKNNKVHYASDKQFKKIVASKWFASCIMNTSLGPWIWRRYWESPLSSYYQPTASQKKQLFLESVFFPYARPVVIRVKQNAIIRKILRG